MFEIKEYDVSIMSRLQGLQEKMKTARDGKDPSCTKCDNNGIIQVSKKLFFADMGEVARNLYKDNTSLMNIECDCYSLEKTKLTVDIDKTLKLQESFRTVFGLSKHTRKEIEELTLSNYGKKFGVENITDTIKKWLLYGMPGSLFFTGKPGTGKTTTMKILWQIMALNNSSVYYFNCQKFEKLCLNLYNKNADGDVEKEINSMVAPVKRADLLLVDDHACMNMNTALIYYLEIFDARSESNKPIVMASNKSFDAVLNSYNSKDTEDSRLMRDRLHSRLIDRLNMHELVFEKSNQVETLA